MTFGARPIKRYIQSNIETLLAREMIAGHVKEGDHVVIDYDQGFVIRPAH